MHSRQVQIRKGERPGKHVNMDLVPTSIRTAARQVFPNRELSELIAHRALLCLLYLACWPPPHPAMSLMSFSRHTLKQLKFVLPGGLLTYYFDSYNVLLRILNGEGEDHGWSR